MKRNQFPKRILLKLQKKIKIIWKNSNILQFLHWSVFVFLQKLENIRVFPNNFVFFLQLKKNNRLIYNLHQNCLGDQFPVGAKNGVYVE